jgi:FkbM family methyltransferase
MRKSVTAPLRFARSALGKLGLDIRNVRGGEHWRAGVEILWHRIGDHIERPAIATVVYDGVTLHFLVRNWADWIQGHHLKGQLYASEELEVIRSAYRGGTFLDIGANVGNHSMFAAGVLKAPRVLAFEPNPDAYAILRCNIALNDLAEVVRHFPVGLSGSSGRASVLVPDPTINLGGAKLIEGDGSIELRPGDELIPSEEPVGFIKIDVEGLEMEVLKGLSQTIARCRPVMFVEVDDKQRAEFENYCRSERYSIEWENRPYTGMANLLLRPL